MGGKWRMDKIGDEHSVRYGIDESLYCTLETNTMLFVNYTGVKIRNKIKF